MKTLTNAEKISLQNQVAVVTGGGRGIGRAIALELASAGAAVAVVARSQPELAESVALIEKKGGRARAFAADVAVPHAVRTAFQAIEQSLGPMDILVNNAATVKPLGPFWETDLEDWWHGMELNVHGPLLCTHAVLPGMIARRHGRIINIASGAGTVSTPYYTSYVTSKTALIRFTECLAFETKPHGIALFSVSPGTVRTTMAEHSLNSPEGKKWLPWFRRIFDENIDVPAERPARLVRELASGRMDALSGKMISIYDDLDQLLKNAGEIEQQDLYSLKMEKLKGAAPNPALNALLSTARQMGK